jgi:hypothetical protein
VLEVDEPRQAHRGKIGNVQSNVCGDVADGITAFVLIQRGIGQFADANAVKNDNGRRAGTPALPAPPPAGRDVLKTRRLIRDGAMRSNSERCAACEWWRWRA